MPRLHAAAGRSPDISHCLAWRGSPCTVTCLCNLAGVCSETGDYPGAQRLIQRVPDAAESGAEDDLLAIASAMGELIHVRCDESDYATAEELRARSS